MIMAMSASTKAGLLIRKPLRHIPKPFPGQSRKYKVRVRYSWVKLVFITVYLSFQVNEIGDAIQFLTVFPKDSVPASLAAGSICTFLASCDHLIPGISLQRFLKDEFYFECGMKRRLMLPTQSEYQTKPKLSDQWNWVRGMMESCIDGWLRSGVSHAHLLWLVHRAKLGAKLGGGVMSRYVYHSLMISCPYCARGNQTVDPIPRRGRCSVFISFFADLEKFLLPPPPLRKCDNVCFSYVVYNSIIMMCFVWLF